MAWPWSPPPRQTARFVVAVVLLLAAAPWPRAAAQAGYHVVSVSGTGCQLSARLELTGAGQRAELGPDVRRLSLTARQVCSFFLSGLITNPSTTSACFHAVGCLIIQSSASYFVVRISAA
ncbi:hypothetical protein Zm00014a_038553 [Zea mays]|jgi:hypothetical protein|uniref:Uncharacterized protein n=1 Tax=Zea mays TaxID=4577 RepID=A0A3L6ECQ7_MAIZE|nr:hypothetical protein Zm00014a_038553 [Zea mays]